MRKKFSVYFKNLPVRTKIIFFMAFMPFGFILTIALIYTSLIRNERSMQERVKAAEDIKILSREISNFQQDNQTALLSFRFDQNPEYVRLIEENHKSMVVKANLLKDKLEGTEGDHHIRTYLSNLQGVDIIQNDLIKSIQSKNEARIRNDFVKWEIKTENMSATIEDLNNYNLFHLTQSVNLYEKFLNQLYLIIALAGLGFFATTTLLYFYLQRLITIPISELSRAANNIAHGNFDFPIPLNSKDELGKLAIDLKTMATKLKENYLNLESQVKSQQITIEKSKEMEDRKDEFISIASHELKTPMTSIKGYLQILHRKLKDYDNQQVQEYLNRTNIYLNRLDKLVTDLLDVSKIQAGKLEFNSSNFYYDELLKDGVESVKHMDSNHKIQIIGKIDEIICGDRERLEQVITNLLSNAIKYSPNADRVVITINKDDSYIMTSIIDFGVGIPKDKLPKIFERFYRVSETSNRFSGLGIGLYISSEIIKRHGGRIWVESEEGKGSIFHFTLPRTKRSKEVIN